jgi:hypothetical protein
MTDTPEMIWAWPYNDEGGIFASASDTFTDPEDVEGNNTGQAYRRVDLPRPEDAVRIAELEAALAEASAAWDAFKVATVSADHFGAVERLDAALQREGGEG